MEPTPQTGLPKYVQRAITSRIAQTGEYARLAPEQWRDLAVHICEDQAVPKEHGGRTFLDRGYLSSTGRGREATLNRLLWGAVVEHAGIARKIPHYESVARLFRTLNSGLTVDPAFFNWE